MKYLDTTSLKVTSARMRIRVLAYHFCLDVSSAIIQCIALVTRRDPVMMKYER